MKTTRTIIIVLIALGAAYYIFTNGSVSQPPAVGTAPAAEEVVVGTAVSIQNLAFSPAALAVAKGDTVTWTNNDSVPHTVTAENGQFNSQEISPGQSWSHTFTVVGTAIYHCSFHPMMEGSVQVR